MEFTLALEFTFSSQRHIILFYVKFGCIIKRNAQSTKFPICHFRLQINQFSIQPVFLHKGIVLTCFCHNTFIQRKRIVLGRTL